MISFFLCLGILIAGYFTYGKLAESVFEPDDRETPAVTVNDGVDYVIMPQWKLAMIQLLNIAGLGPIFGAISGAIWGPVVFLWITFGTIFAGAVHDYMSGMMSIRHRGVSITEITGEYLGEGMRNVMRVFSVILLCMVGTVFAVGPAGLLKTLCLNSGMAPGGLMTSLFFWLALIIIYYFVATFLAIDRIIGWLYPIFGICLIIMALGVCWGLLTGDKPIPELWDNFKNLHPKGTPIWAFMFITVACGAISGFHATQSPLMARCMGDERQGHFVFYGAMVAEGFIALVWAAAGCALHGSQGLLDMGGGNAVSVYKICVETMGGFGVILAMLGVIACPITSGDTAFRSARLIVADWVGVEQGKWENRIMICIPVLSVGSALAFGNALGVIDYGVIWRYFSWSNQTLAMIVLWSGAMYLVRHGKNFWICAIPATFMSAVSVTYFMMAPECMGLIPFFRNNALLAYPLGIVAALVCCGIFFVGTSKYRGASGDDMEAQAA